MTLPTLAQLADDLAHGRATSESLTRDCLSRIDDPAGEGQRAFISVFHESAMDAARASDARRAAGAIRSPIDGLPVSIKDLFDVQGQVTRAGSVVLNDALPAIADAPIVARLKAAGAVLIGRTNMTEFAYGANGMNAHYGTPLNPWDRAAKRIPGGSTSGGAVSVTDGMATGTIGSDTGGSVRIPAALCGLAGFKPTQRRVSLDGAFPLSFTRDSVGPLGATVACCALLDGILSGVAQPPLEGVAIRGMKLGVPKTILLDGLDESVARAFSAALSRLSQAGALIEEFDFHVLDRERAGSVKANFSAVEAFALHRERLEKSPEKFDPRVRQRLMLGATMSASDYVDLVLLRKSLIAQANAVTSRFDALLAPTVPIIAPRIAELEASDAEFYRINGLLLRNCAPFNVLDRPCVSVPCHTPGEAPVGLMVVGETMGDSRALAVAMAIESALAR